jgi:hypothetical protein
MSSSLARTGARSSSESLITRGRAVRAPIRHKDAHVKEITAADLDKLANLMRICGFLMQTKAYLLLKSGWS